MARTVDRHKSPWKDTLANILEGVLDSSYKIPIYIATCRDKNNDVHRSEYLRIIQQSQYLGAGSARREDSPIRKEYRCDEGPQI